MDTPKVYGEFAVFYDRLMQDAPYDEWMRIFIETVNRHLPGTGGPRSQLKVADLGCGTGTLSILLLEQGFQVFAVDLSEEMLAQAQAKLSHPTPFLRFFQQDLRSVRLPEKVDYAVSFCDSLNYLLEESDLRQAFHSIRHQLKPGGFFLFDMHTPYKLREELGHQTFYDIREDVAYIWQSRLDSEKCQVEYDVTFFAQVQEDLYRRFHETHWQRAYSREAIEGLLHEAGFTSVECGADFHWVEPGEKASRYFFLAR
ncbi:class I SAM-dependent DNA methyltransferase [Effusibacillus lacus]|uniref:Methyltransferase type 12 n=1 Tax=Effusibacillus lacus TaxID=1348429 RepID=A0A292YLG6_9BACL|nr:class I SAM-dependent methyltransferase [Effusibacillus lacus]TCS72851.1 methyltransferase family protein [Effusibacillus lacus]GAX89224.1 methyltransferase type 12 [Effusibacillus lacus]